MENDIKINTVSVLMKIQMLQPTLSRAEQRVAEYILNNSSKVISLSVAGLADLSGVSDATVVRACKSFGFSSYQEFKVTLARNTVSPLQSIHAESSHLLRVYRDRCIDYISLDCFEYRIGIIIP